MNRRLAVFAGTLLFVTGLYVITAQTAQRGGGGGRGGGGEQPTSNTAQRGQGRRKANAPDLLSFFVTSAGIGNGGNLGGLEGADKHCATLAEAAGSTGNKTWHAYLSTQASGNQPAVNARDRIGQGPWYNADGALVADNLPGLHGEGVVAGLLISPVNRTVSLTEFGNLPSQPNLITGSMTDGRAYTDGMDHTCNNWTSNDAGSTRIGNYGGGGGAGGGGEGLPSWNSIGNRGCTQQSLGTGLFYCFATK